MVRIRQWRNGSGAVVATCLAAQVHAHTPAYVFDRVDISNWVEMALDDRMIGWEFTVAANIEITALGVYDRPFPSPDPGLGAFKQVGIWDLGENLIATATIGPGEDGSLCEDDFRYVDVTPVTLMAGNSYVIAAFWPDAPFDHHPAFPGSGIDPVYDSSIGFVQTRTSQGGFAFPGTVDPGTEGVSAVNFRIGVGGCNALEPAIFETTFESNNHFAGNMFDLRALDPDGLTVTGWQVNLGDTVPQSTLVNVSIYWREGSYADASSSASGWNELGTVPVFSRGINRGTPVPIGGLVLPFDEIIGIYIFLTDYVVTTPPPTIPEMYYTNIGEPGAFATYTNADIELTGGLAKGGPPFTGLTFGGRMWNGGLDYVDNGEPNADVNEDGTIDSQDLVAVILAWGSCPACAEDVNGDGEVDAQDLVLVILGWG